METSSPVHQTDAFSANYNSIAHVYDRMMNHVDYSSWVRLIQTIVRKYVSYYFDHPAIFEIGAGTGTLGQLLKKNGFHYTGSDLCLYMCKEAAQKNCALLCTDGRFLPIRSQKFSFVLFLYDGINYLQTEDDYVRLFKEVHRVLGDDGFFLFDVTTEFNSLTNFFDLTEAHDWGDIAYIRHSYYDEKKKIQHNDFSIFSTQQSKENDCPAYIRTVERHSQKIFSVNEIVDFISFSHFDLMGIWDNFSFSSYKVNSERIHFLLKKTKQND
ncbi:MAG: class I SAM-dependent methyltransferase [Chitinivibrionales bacterium]|nr:class I SAM-dependent methyltransferase [Chitinivibrionales bacterium]